jgi:hypothetical protein
MIFIASLGLAGCKFGAVTASLSEVSSEQSFGSNGGGSRNSGARGHIGDGAPSGILISNQRVCYDVMDHPFSLYHFHFGNMTSPSQVRYVIAQFLPDDVPDYNFPQSFIEAALASPGAISGTMEISAFSGTSFRYPQLEASEFRLPNVSAEKLSALRAMAAQPRQHPVTYELVTAEVRMYVFAEGKILSSSYGFQPATATPPAGGAGLHSEGWGAYAFHVRTTLISRRWHCRNYDSTNPEIREVCEKACDAIQSPLILDLKGNGVQTTSLENGVRFDIDADGSANAVAWIMGSSERGWDDAFLARDLNTNGRIDDGAELFGSATRLKDGSLAVNGFIALQDLDSNRDKIFDRRDKAFQEVVLWMDRNQDGKSQPWEMIPLGAFVRSIDLKFEPMNDEDQYGNKILAASKFIDKRGRELSIIDIFFKFEE